MTATFGRCAIGGLVGFLCGEVGYGIIGFVISITILIVALEFIRQGSKQ
jgi:predicted PurR-regulated permease PerM